MALSNNQRIIVSHGAAVRLVRERVTEYVRLRWNQLGAYYPADVEAWADAIVPLIEASQKQVWQLNNTYFDALIREKGLRPQAAAKVMSYDEIRGVSAKEVYTRPGVTARMAIGEGKSVAEAARLGAQRLTQIIASDMQMANARSAFSKTSADTRMIGYRRVIQSANPCALCLLASTQRYHREDLMPIHSHYSCDVEPLFGTEDRQVIDEEILEGTRERLEAMGLNTSSGYNSLVSVKFHGELGPVLTTPGHRFTGPDDLI